MKRFLITLSVLFQVFVLSSLPAFAAPAAADNPSSLLTAGLDAAAAESGYNKNLGLTSLIGKLIAAVLGLIGIVFVIFLVLAGIMYLTASGDDTKVKKAKAMIRDSVIGLIIIVSAYAISTFVVGQLLTATTT